MDVKVLILTPLPLEYDAVVKHLTGARNPTIRDAAAYEMGTFIGKHHTYSVAVREPGMKNVDMALATEKAIQHIKPQIVLLIGIAGSVKDVRIGDVVIAGSAFNYESGKETESGFLARPAEYHFSEDLLAHAQVLSRSQAWKKRTSDGAPEATVLIGPIASGDKVVAGTDNPTFERIKQNLSHIKALEMEAGGFGRTVQSHRHLHALVIRGISDMCAGKAETDQQNWQPIAAERAAAVGFELLDEMDCSSFIIPVMDAKMLAKEIYSLLFPLPESIKEIGNDFANAGNNEVREIWKRVKPLFIEEVGALAKSPEDADVQADVRNKLKKELEGKEGVREELAAMLEKAKASGHNTSISVVNSKNVVAGSTISVGGDFRLGDG